MTSRGKSNVRGWLRRRGQRIHTWSRLKWFVLSDKFIFVYVREDDRKHQDIIQLSKQIIVEPPVDPSDPKVGCFDIVTENSPSETISLCAETLEEKKTWMRALKRMLYADRGGALFSQSLEEILVWEHQEGRQIPYIVDECVEYLYKYGLDAEGIFRLGGRMAAIKEVIARFERGEKVKFEDENTDVHVVSSVLKTFLRDLPDSIIPCAYFQRFMNIALRYMDSKEAKVKDLCIEELAAAMKEIPKDNYIILKYICRFLSKVADHENSNKMNSLTVGTIFGPNLIRHVDNENPHLHLCTADLGQHLVHMMLQYFPKVFQLEYSDVGTVGNNVPTADLLSMSRVAEVPVPPPRSPKVPTLSISAMEDLEGIDLGSQSDYQSAAASNGSVSVAEDFLSAPSSPLADGTRDDVFTSSKALNNKTVASKGRSLHLSLKGTKHDIDLGWDPGSPDSVTSDPPVRPARTKSKKLTRNRPLVDHQRPNMISVNKDKSSPCSESPETVLSETDALPRVAKFHTLPPGMSLSNPVFRESSATKANKEEAPESPSLVKEEETPLPSSAVKEEEPSCETENEDGKLGPSSKDLALQVSALKKEIGVQREHYRNQVTALTSQLSEMQSKYEHRIETMEAKFKSQKQELENKLERERAACSTAVEKTIRLKEELHRYQMQYGELPLQ